MWIPRFLRRRPPTLNQQKQRISNVLKRRFKKEQGATSYYYNKYLSNLVKNVLKEGGNARTITLPNISRMRDMNDARKNISNTLEQRFKTEQGRYSVRKELLNSLITSVLRNNKNPNTMILPQVGNFGTNNFNPNNWTYVRKNMKNTVRQYPGLTGNRRIVIVRNTKTSPWRLATVNEINRLNNRQVNYGTQTQ
jgi:hypothetical protein